MSWLIVAVPTALASLVLFVFGVPAIYREVVPFASVGYLAFLLVLTFAMFRGYRERIITACSPARLLAYLAVFLAVNHVVNMFCFLNIELPVEYRHASVGPGILVSVAVVLTIVHLVFTTLNWIALGIALRVMGSNQAWGLAARIAIYALPASLIVALPGADSWKAALVALLAAQAFTLWRLKVERALGHGPEPVVEPAIVFMD